MKTSTLLLIGLAGVAAYYFEQLNTAGNTLQVVFNSIKINSALNYTLEFVIQNVSNATLNVNSMAADVTINGNDFGNVSSFTPVQILPNSATPVYVTLAPNPLTIPSTVIALFNAPTGNFDFNVNGNMNVNGLVLPLTLEKMISI